MPSMSEATGTLNNMLHARLLEGSPSKAWVDKVPGIMLSLNAMPHEPHRFSASMIATAREPTLPPDVQLDATLSPAVDDPSDYMEAITQQLQLTHQQIASPYPPSVANSYQVGSLIFAMTTPPERASKLSPCWKGPFYVCRIPSDYQVVYEGRGKYSGLFILIMPNPQNLLPPIFRGQCQLMRLLVLLLGIYQKVLPGPRPPPPAPVSPAGDSFSSST